MWLEIASDGTFSVTSPPPAAPPQLITGIPIPALAWEPATLPNLAESAQAPEPPEAWMVRRWRVEDGLPQNFIRALQQTPDGYLWIGTASGLTRFDGRRFVTYNEVNTPEFSATSADIRRLACDRQGRLLVGAVDGVLRLESGQWQFLGTTRSEGKNRIRDLAADASDRVWIATERGLRLLTNGIVSTHGVPALLATTSSLALGISSNDVLWISTAAGTLTWLFDHTEPARLGPVVGSFAPTGTHSMWLRLIDGALRRSPGETFPGSLFGDPNPSFAHFGFYQGGIATGPNDDCAYFASPRFRLYLNRQGIAAPVLTSEGRFVEEATCVTWDQEGNLWCGTRNSGLLRLRRQTLRPLVVEEPESWDRVDCVTEDIHGSIWCTTAGGAIQWSRFRTRLLHLQESPIAQFGYSITSVPSGIVWAGFQEGTAIALGPATNTLLGNPIPHGVRLPVAPERIRVLYRMRNALFLVGNRSGLFSPSYFHITTAHGLGHKDVRALLEDRHGDLWVGTYGGGISRISNLSDRHTNFTVQTFNTTHGLSHDEAWSLHEDPDGALWIGTQHGLNRFKDGRFFVFTTAHGLHEDLINHLLQDDFGCFWISGNRGIYRIRRADLNAVADGTATRVHPAAFGEADGMLTAETQGESQPAGCKASDGRLYFPTHRGLVVIDPREHTAQPPPPQVVIEQVVADGEPFIGEGLPLDPGTTASTNAPRRIVGVPASIKIPPGQAHSLAIRYTAASLSNPDRVQFEHRLVGLDDRWRTGTPERVANYGHLEPGTYRFEIRASNHRGVWSPVPALLSVTLQPHFTQTPLFYLLIAAVIAGFITALVLYRLRFQKRLLLLQQQHALELERTRIARDMHDRLGANLSRLALSAPSTGVSQTQVRETLRELKDLIWSVHPKNDSLTGMAEFLADAAQQYLEAAGISLDLDWPHSLPDLEIPGPTRQHLASAFKESLRNIVQHAQATLVRIHLRADLSRLQLTIADNGHGFDTATAVAGNGLKNLHDRLHEIAGTCRIESVPGSGTSIHFEIPLPSTPSP